MILRRITKHVKDQNWFAVGLDFCIVVAGILIAFQITNWSERQQENIQAKHVLERLEQDLMQELEQIDHSLIRHEQYMKAAGRLIEGVRLGVFDEERLISDINEATDASFAPGPSTAFQELVSSGETDLVRNEVLRNALYGYNSYASFFRAEYSTFTVPLAQTSAVLMPARTVSVTGIPSKDFTELGRTQSVDSSVLLDNPEILSSLQTTYIMQDNVHYVLMQFHERVEGILTLIKEEKERAK